MDLKVLPELLDGLDALHLLQSDLRFELRGIAIPLSVWQKRAFKIPRVPNCAPFSLPVVHRLSLVAPSFPRRVDVTNVSLKASIVVSYWVLPPFSFHLFRHGHQHFEISPLCEGA